MPAEDFDGVFGEYPGERSARVRVEAILGAPVVPMHEYLRPAAIFWEAFALALRGRGLSDPEVFAQMQSKGVRWMLDGDLSEILERAAREMAERYVIVDLEGE